MKSLRFDIYLFLDALSKLYLSRPLQSLARLGQKVTHWQWCLAGVLHCLSVIQKKNFLSRLILRSPCGWYWNAHSDIGDICGNASICDNLHECLCTYVPPKERAIAHHQEFFEAVLLWRWILPRVILPPRLILLNSATESTFSENEFFLPWCRLLLWGKRKLLRRGDLICV